MSYSPYNISAIHPDSPYEDDPSESLMVTLQADNGGIYVINVAPTDVVLKEVSKEFANHNLKVDEVQLGTDLIEEDDVFTFQDYGIEDGARLDVTTTRLPKFKDRDEWTGLQTLPTNDENLVSHGWVSRKVRANVLFKEDGTGRRVDVSWVPSNWGYNFEVSGAKFRKDAFIFEDSSLLPSPDTSEDLEQKKFKKFKNRDKWVEASHGLQRAWASVNNDDIIWHPWSSRSINPNILFEEDRVTGRMVDVSWRPSEGTFPEETGYNFTVANCVPVYGLRFTKSAFE